MNPFLIDRFLLHCGRLCGMSNASGTCMVGFPMRNDTVRRKCCVYVRVCVCARKCSPNFKWALAEPSGHQMTACMSESVYGFILIVHSVELESWTTSWTETRHIESESDQFCDHDVNCWKTKGQMIVSALLEVQHSSLVHQHGNHGIKSLFWSEMKHFKMDGQIRREKLNWCW